MADKKKNHRRKLIVNPELQRRLIRDVSVVPIVALIIGAIVIALSFRVFISEANAAGLELPGIYGLLGSLAGFVFLSCYVTLSIAARISNRIAGPLYRLHKVLEQIKDGDTSARVTFRKGDYLMETADVFNRFMESMEKKIPQNGANPASGNEGIDRKEEASELMGVGDPGIAS